MPPDRLAGEDGCGRRHQPRCFERYSSWRRRLSSASNLPESAVACWFPAAEPATARAGSRTAAGSARRAIGAKRLDLRSILRW